MNAPVQHLLTLSQQTWCVFFYALCCCRNDFIPPTNPAPHFSSIRSEVSLLTTGRDIQFHPQKCKGWALIGCALPRLWLHEQTAFRKSEKAKGPTATATAQAHFHPQTKETIEKRVRIQIYTYIFLFYFWPLGPNQGLLFLSASWSIPRSVVSFFRPVFLQLSCVIIRLTDRPTDRQTYT